MKLFIVIVFMIMIGSSIAFGQSQSIVNATVDTNILNQLINQNEWIGGVVGGKVEKYKKNLEEMIQLSVNEAIVNNPNAVQYDTAIGIDQYIIRAQVLQPSNLKCKRIEVNIYHNRQIIFSEIKKLC